MTTSTDSHHPPQPPSTLFHPHHPASPSADTPPDALLHPQHPQHPQSNHQPSTMTSFGPQFPPQHQASNGSRVAAPPSRHSRDYSGHAHNGANGNGQASAVPIHNRMGSGPGHMRAMSGFEGARSPPNSKSTAHVPCKFFRQGVCQAGKACPFLHSTEPATETAPCKYFQKGNCKFGGKCALAHILPDGRRVNGPGMGMGRHPYGRPHYPPEPSLLTQQAMAGPGPQSPYPYMPSDDPYVPAQPKQIHDMIPTIDQTFSSNPGSNFGSPPNDARLPTSPMQKGLSVLDAPLPASFDSQGISHMARYGPIAASVPSRFGLESSSPPSSYTNKPAESAALRNLHNSAFGEEARAQNGFGSSPPAAEEPFGGRRIMHSERFSRPKMLSASLGTRTLAGGDEWDENFTFEEDLVPNSLHELLTPQEKMRRFSRAGEEDHSFNHRQSLSGLGTPGESKVGSPLASSPSRFGALFSRAYKTVPEDPAGSSPGASAFGHVGSPLRNSSLIPNAASSSPGLRPIGGDRRTTPSSSSMGEPSPFGGLSSPPRQASMSMISQQLQRTRLSSLVSDSKPEGSPSPDSHTPTHPHPGMPRLGSASSVGSVASASGAPSAMSMAMRPGLGIDHRAVSSTSIGRERIEEEQEQGLFDMEEEEERALSVAGSDGRKAKRYSGISVASGGGSASGNTSTAVATASGGGSAGTGAQNGGSASGSNSPWGSSAPFGGSLGGLGADVTSSPSTTSASAAGAKGAGAAAAATASEEPNKSAK
ncbi:hypothetical protein BKA81DRAFT_366927 [Phyllosticta paracitricarpa]